MRVLLADKLPERARHRLEGGGFEVRSEPGLTGPALGEALEAFDPDVLVVRSTRVEAAHLSVAPSLSLVVRAGAGVDTIDLDACSGRGVFVANCPGRNAVAVAELTFGLLLALDRHLPDNVADARAGRWNKAAYGKARGLAGRTLGILGMGRIGQEVARRARAFDMEVVAWSRSLTEERADALEVERAASPVAVASRCDVLTVHLAETPETREIVGPTVLDALSPGAMLLNTSRAGLVDEEALLKALDAGGLRAGLDVVRGEPSFKEGEWSHPLARHPRVYLSHHIGASTAQAQLAVADEACRVVEGFRARGRVDNAVNVSERTGADRVLVVRHLDRVGVLAGVLDELREARINVEEMENTIFAGGAGAVARMHLSGPLPPDLLERLRGQENVLAVVAMDLTQEGP